MANYNKSFNFTNGLQVDNDNFIVNSSGLVGVGTTNPTAYLDVYGISALRGNVTISGVTSSTQSYVTGVSTFASDTFVGSGITLYSSSGIVSATKFYGDGTNLTGIYAVATGGWFVDSTAGIAHTDYSIGIGTTSPDYKLDVHCGNDDIGVLLTSSDKNAYYSAKDQDTSTTPEFGAVGDSFDVRTSTLRRFTVNPAGLVGIGSTLPSTNLDVNGTTKTTNLNVTGVSTVGITSITELKVIDQLYVSGVSTFAGITTVTGDTLFSKQLVLSGVSTFAGISTFGDGIGIANSIFHTGDTDTSIRFSTADTIIVKTGGSDRVSISSVGDVNVSGTTTTGHLTVTGVTTTNNTIHVKHNNTAASTVAVGKSDLATGYVGKFRYGHTSGNFKYSDYESLDIINTSPGGFNFISNPNLITGSTGYPRFTWTFGEASDPKLTLLKNGNFGIGTTDPVSALHVVGVGTFDTLYADAFNVLNQSNFSGNVIVATDRYIQSSDFRGNVKKSNGIVVLDSGALANATDGRVNVNSYNTVGISTFNKIHSTNNIGINVIAELQPLVINGSEEDGTRRFVVDDEGNVGLGTTVPSVSVDLRNAGSEAETKSVILPYNTTTQRNAIGNNAAPGTIIYNTSLRRIEVYDGENWVGITTEA